MTEPDRSRLDTAVIFVTDGGYLAPSVLAAKQLLKQSADQLADLFIYTVDVDPAVTKRLAKQIVGLTFLPLEARDFVPPPSVSFLQSHVPITTLARLSLEPEIPVQYKNLVYLDGDTQIIGDVSNLLRYRVPDGNILAARGSSWLDPSGRHQIDPEGYLEALGNVSKEDYFNAGVLAFRRDTWALEAPKALAFYFEHSKIATRYDQSALNAIFKGRVIPMAPAYNFHSYYAQTYVQLRYHPKIIHFTGPNKPWAAPQPPWGARFRQSYIDVLSEHPDLRGFFTVNPDLPYPRRYLRRGLSWAHEVRRLCNERTVTQERRRLFREYLAGGHFPFT